MSVPDTSAGHQAKPEELGPPPELKPCPFCGNPLTVRWRRINPKASCTTENCWGARLPTLTLDVPEAVAAWNTRHDNQKGDK